jgi:hypothetical protein
MGGVERERDDKMEADRGDGGNRNVFNTGRVDKTRILFVFLFYY